MKAFRVIAPIFCICLFVIQVMHARGNAAASQAGTETVYAAAGTAVTDTQVNGTREDASGTEKAAKGTEQSGIASVFSFGAAGDGRTDDTEAIQKAVSSDQPVYFPSGTYLISRPIVITGKIYWSMYAQDARFVYTGESYAFRILSAENCHIEMGYISASQGGGIEFYSDSITSWNQYIFLSFNCIECKTDCIHVEVKSPGWSTENQIYGGRFKAGQNGVHVHHPGQDYTNGWKFYNCGIEGVANGFLFDAGDGYINDMAVINPRYEESYETILRTKGTVFNCLWVGTSVIKKNELDCSDQTTRFEIIAPIGSDGHRGCITNGKLMKEKTEYEEVRW